MSGILFDHVAIAMARIAAAPAFLVGELGGVPHDGAASPEFTFGQWRFAGGGRIEVLEPRGEGGFLHRFLAQHGPGIHHVTFKVPSLRQACDHAEAHGYTIVGYRDSNPGWGEAFLHPKQALGIVVQLAQSKASIGEEGRRSWQAPPGPATPPPSVTLLGLRLTARSRERARAQWGSVLEGQGADDASGELVYRWPGSPMRLVVEIDPTRDEGPICIEFTSRRRIPVPEARHPVLGAVFVQRSDSTT